MSPRKANSKLQKLSPFEKMAKHGSVLILSDMKRANKRITGPEVIKLFSSSTQLSMKFSPLIDVKMPTIVGILTCMSGKITF